MARFVVRYPIASGDRITLRAEPDWSAVILPIEEDHDRMVFDVPIPDRGVRQLKPILEREGHSYWSVSANYILRSDVPEQIGYPCFLQQSGRLTGRMSIDAPALGDAITVRIYLPAGYDENTLKSYPVLYAADGANLFDPAESSVGQEWEVDETIALLDRMSVIRKIIVVGVYARGASRSADYTLPGYEATGRAWVRDLVPRVDRTFRTLAGPANRSVLGSSLGGVLALYLLWEYPEVFGSIAAMSATFGHGDDLFTRVATEPSRLGRVYLDSGWPLDNFEAVRKMAHALTSRGMSDLHYAAHPRGLHSELHWADRLHLPLQFLFGER